MADAHVAAQLFHVPLLEHVAHQAAALALEQLAVLGGDDAGGVLAAVLEDRERVVEAVIDGFRADDADDAAHGVRLLCAARKARVME